MPARTENLGSNHGIGNGQRWRLNTNGQLVDADAASTGWDLADEIVRLKIGDATGGEDMHVHGPVRTPPKSKISGTTVMPVPEASPLDTSSAASSPHGSESQVPISHSRGSSTDTTVSSSRDSAPHNLLGHVYKGAMPNELKERSLSHNSGLSGPEFRRHAPPVNQYEGERQIQQQTWAQAQHREHGHADGEQMAYPSLTSHIHRPQPQPHPQMYNFRSVAKPARMSVEREDHHIDYNVQQPRSYNQLQHQGHNVTAAASQPPFIAGRADNGMQSLGFRQPPRPYGQQGMLPTPNALGYPGHPATHLNLGNVQQLYDMMIPAPLENHPPAVPRVPQQHSAFRGTHHHSLSDPSAIRDAAAMALLNSNMQTFAPGMFQPAMTPAAMSMYASQFYGPQDVAAVHAISARLQSQYVGQYATSQGIPSESMSSPSSANDTSGAASGNRKLSLYKTELCRSWEEKGTCRYGAKCQFAHGEDELRKVSRHPKYKTEICRTFWVSGSCPYGKRCCFIHTELPSSGIPGAASQPGTENASQQTRPDGRARSLSTNSDPNSEGSVSLLQRIAAKPNSSSTSMDLNANGFQFTRPPSGSLRVDTSALEGPSLKQNKSAYPSFASNGILLPAPEPLTAKSPAPVTAGPDFGRHAAARIDIVGYNNQQQPLPQIARKSNNAGANVRHSFSGADLDLNFASVMPTSSHSSFALPSKETAPVSRVNGHVRAGSAGNWASLGRNNPLVSSGYTANPSGDILANLPWSTTELAVGSSRLNENAWA